MHGLACLAEGLGMRATARVCEVAPNTVLQWLVEAAEQRRAFAAYCLCEVHVNQGQLEELYAVLREVKASEMRADEAITPLEHSPSWMWTAMDRRVRCWWSSMSAPVPARWRSAWCIRSWRCWRQVACRFF